MCRATGTGESSKCTEENQELLSYQTGQDQLAPMESNQEDLAGLYGVAGHSTMGNTHGTTTTEIEGGKGHGGPGTGKGSLESERVEADSLSKYGGKAG